jgi:hypothetical protein
MDNTAAGLLKLSKNINGLKKKSGSCGFELSNTANRMVSSTVFGICVNGYA